LRQGVKTQLPQEFFSVGPLVAVAVLAINDAWLKPTFHNALTGKLSDFAGCYFLPLYVSALLSLVTEWSLRVRVAVGAMITIALFVSVSLSPSAARSVCDLLELIGRPLGLGPQWIASDPTDLIALPMVLLAALRHGRVEATGQARFKEEPSPEA